MMKIYSTKRLHPFTLIEMLLVFALICVVSTVLVINLSRSVSEEEFQQSAHKLLERMELAQSFMAYAQADVRLHFKRDDQGTIYCVTEYLGKNIPEVYDIFVDHEELESRIEAESEGAPEPMLLKKGALKLPGLRNIRFSTSRGEATPLEDITLIFASPGGLMSKGQLLLYRTEDVEDEQTVHITLKGYPSPLKLEDKPLYNIYEQDNTIPPYPQELQAE